MKISICSQHFWPENFRINDIVLRLQRNHDIRVYTGQPNYPQGEIYKGYDTVFPKSSTWEKVEIVRFPILKRGKSSALKLIINYTSYIISYLIFFPFFYKKTDVFFIYGTSPILQAIPVIFYAKLLKIKTVLWVQDLWPENLVDTGYIENKYLIKAIKFLVKIIYDSSDLVLCQSNNFKKKIIFDTPTEIRVFYNPSNFQFKKNFSFKKQKGNFFEIFYTGNIGFGQNFDTIFKAMEYAQIYKKKIRLTIYGNGKNKKNLEASIKKKRLKNVIFKNSVSANKLEKIMSKADCFYITLNKGTGLTKTLPAKFQTYLAYGKPILSTAGEAVNDIIKENKIGYFCDNDVKNYKYLFKSILSMQKLNEIEMRRIFNNSKKLFFRNFCPINNNEILNEYFFKLNDKCKKKR